MRIRLLTHLIRWCMACTVLLTGCIRLPAAAPELHEAALRFTPPPGMANIYILHQKEWASHDMPFMVSLDAEFVGSILAGQYIFGAVEPGSHELWLRALAKSNTLRFNAEPGQVYFFNSNIPFMSSPKIKHMEDGEGRRKTSAYEQSAHNDLIYPITRAARFGQKERVQTLLAAGEDANAKDWWGKTALIWAVERGDEEIVRLLIDHGAVDVFKTASDELKIKTRYTALKMAHIKKELTEQIALSAEEVRAKGGKVWKLSKPQTREKIILFEGMSADLFKVAVGQIELGVVSKDGTIQHEYAFLSQHVSTSHAKKVKRWASDVTIAEFYKPDTGWRVTPTAMINKKTNARATLSLGSKAEMPKIDVIGSSKYGQTFTDYSFPIHVSARIGMGLTTDLGIAKPTVFIFNAKGELQDVYK